MDIFARDIATVDGVAGTQIPYSRGIWMAISAFTAVAWYNILELNVQVFLTFKRHRGLYFWALIISGYGCVLHALGFLLKFFQLTTNNYVSVTIITIGWYAMVTGQSVVLYSRLHLVVREQRVLRAILAMIIVDAICFHIPTTVLTYGTSHYTNANTSNPWNKPFNVMEKLQMTAFCIQEFIISGVYVYSTVRLLRPVYHGRTRKVMMQLIWINSIIIAMDIGLLAVEYSNKYTIEATMKSMFYSIKLKLEFAVLNQLMTLANSSVNAHQTLQVEDSEKGSKPPTGRSKSTEYISKKYEKPSKRERASQRPRFANKPSDISVQRPASSASSSYGALGSPSKSHLQFIPTLDRNIVIEAKHIENAKKQRINPELNALNNPAAHFKPSRRVPPHDKYGFITDDDDLEPVISPTLTGTTVTPQSPQPPPPPPRPRPIPEYTASESNLNTNYSRRRAPPPPNLDFSNPVMPNGLIRSTRPSVSEWGRGPDGEVSPGSDELQLNPYDVNASPRSPGSVRAARERASKQTGLDFVTSALR